jgi:hypothetical protein
MGWYVLWLGGLEVWACHLGPLVLVYGVAGCGVELVLVQVAVEQVWVVQREQG